MEKYITIDDNNICYKLYNPENDKCVVLIHGYGVTGQMWEPQLEALSEYKIIVPDVRCHGKSRPCSDFTIIDAARDIVEILACENIQKAYITGLSMGGYIAQEIGRMHPELVSGLIVSSATPVFMKYPKWEKISLKYSGGMLNLFSWEYLKKLMSKYTSTDDSVIAQLYDMFSQMTKKEFITAWNGISTCLHEDDTALDFPLCFICGDKDKSGTIKMHADDWVKLYPHCQTHIIENASHMANMDNPEAFNSILLDFMV